MHIFLFILLSFFLNQIPEKIEEVTIKDLDGKSFSIEPTRFATQDELERITPTLDEKGKNKF